MDKKKNKFLSNKGFVLFGILALIIVLVAVFAPVLAGGIDPTAGSLADAIMPPDAKHIFGTEATRRYRGMHWPHQWQDCLLHRWLSGSRHAYDTHPL